MSVALKGAVLGLLVERRGYGYELVQRLAVRLGPAWQLSPSTVYAALDQLEADGYVTDVTDAGMPFGSAGRRRARRVVYEATESGRDAFEGWLAQPSLQAEPIRGNLALRIAAARRGDLSVLLDATGQAEQIARSVRSQAIEAAPPAGERRWEDAMSALIALRAIRRLDGELDWLTHVRQALEALASGPLDGAVPTRLIPSPD
ncbi:MAG: PadR family transcriptional regulator [Solirubrobacterales bacterium]